MLSKYVVCDGTGCKTYILCTEWTAQYGESLNNMYAAWIPRMNALPSAGVVREEGIDLFSPFPYRSVKVKDFLPLSFTFELDM